MDQQHDQTSNDKINDDETELIVSKKVFIENSSDDEIEQDIHESSITPIPESFNGDEHSEDGEIDPTVTNGFHRLQVDENIPQQTTILNGSSSDDNGASTQSITTTEEVVTTAQPTTTATITAKATGKNNERSSPINHQHTLRESQQIPEHSSTINGPGLAKPVHMTSSSKESMHSRPNSTNNSSTGKKRIDAALEKNIETIVTQVRRTTAKPSQLTQNDLQLFDNTTSASVIKNGHHSRETTPITSHSNHKQSSSSSSREMTPDSINADSANEDQQQTVRNGQHYHRSVHLPASAVDLTAPSISPYGPQGWPPAVYPFAHQHPGLYLPYPPTGTTSTPTNGLPTFYPAYDPLIIEQHYGPQGLSAFYAQQQQQQQQQQQNHHHHGRRFQENSTPSEHLSSSLTTPTKEPGEHSPVGSGDSIRSADSISSGRRKNKTPSVSSQTHASVNGSLTKLSPDHSSDGAANNDADSVASFESQKSTSNGAMPVLEDGLSDSECISGDEESSTVKSKANGRHRSTQSDFLFDSTNHSSLITAAHKRQFAKSTSTMTNGVDTSNSKAFYIRPPPPSSFVQPVNSTRSPVNKSPTLTQTKTPSEQTSTPVTTDYDTDEETDKLLGLEHRVHVKNQAVRDAAISKPGNKLKSREVLTRTFIDPENSSVLIEGVLFRCRYLGSTQLMVEGNPTKASRMIQAQEAVGRIKAPLGESQPSVEVDLFISTEKIMVLNTDLQDILMDHSLRSISYIADIGDLVVLMAKRRYLQHTDDNNNGHDDGTETNSTRRVVSINQKMICHVFESDEAQSIAHSIGQAFQVAYVEFLKANGIDDPSFTRDIDYQEVLNQQEIGSEELDRFSKKECQKEVIVPKSKNEPLGVVIVESGWGSMLPTVVIANMMPGGPAARCGHLNIGDQIISVNGISLVGLPLSSCQTQIKSVKHLTTVRLVVVPCPPVVEVLIRRPDTKYQLGFSVQNGIICSLLRGGIAERGGVRVGHRIIEINGHSVVATQHEKIVSMLSNSIGELRMKTMPTQMYRLLTGQETPTYI